MIAVTQPRAGSRLLHAHRSCERLVFGVWLPTTPTRIVTNNVSAAGRRVAPMMCGGRTLRARSSRASDASIASLALNRYAARVVTTGVSHSRRR